MKKWVLFLSILCASGLTLVSIYNTVVDAKSWGSDIPASIQTARDYYLHVDPRRFYGVAGPLNLLLILLVGASMVATVWFSFSLMRKLVKLGACWRPDFRRASESLLQLWLLPWARISPGRSLWQPFPMPEAMEFCRPNCARLRCREIRSVICAP